MFINIASWVVPAVEYFVWQPQKVSASSSPVENVASDSSPLLQDFQSADDEEFVCGEMLVLQIILVLN